jgi:hypothetical protein
MEVINSNSNSRKITKIYYKCLSRRISTVNKRLLNSEIILDPLKTLENQALNSHFRHQSDGIPSKKIADKPGMLTLILKSEHKINDQTCIVKLPKMPFGKHLDYNNDEKFVLKHFHNPSNPQNNEKNLEFTEISKKFRLQDKLKQYLKRNKTGYMKNRYSNVYESYDMEHGELVCKKEEKVLEVYNNDKQKYQKFVFETNNASQRLKTPKYSKLQIKLSVDRLHSAGRQNESQKSILYTSKYSNLFKNANKNN